jgi:hypothetical protein
MTRGAEELLVSRDEHVYLKVPVEHIKKDLFPKANFFLARMNGMLVE